MMKIRKFNVAEALIEYKNNIINNNINVILCIT
mgnify:CR=1 FL=1|jgi:hypothetical protein